MTTKKAIKSPAILFLSSVLLSATVQAQGLIDERTPVAPVAPMMHAQPMYPMQPMQPMYPAMPVPAAPGTYAQIPYAMPAVSGVVSGPAWLAPLTAPNAQVANTPVPLAQAILSAIPVQVGAVQLNGAQDVLARSVVVPYGRSYQAALEAVAMAGGVSLVL